MKYFQFVVDIDVLALFAMTIMSLTIRLCLMRMLVLLFLIMLSMWGIVGMPVRLAFGVLSALNLLGSARSLMGLIVTFFTLLGLKSSFLVNLY